MPKIARFEMPDGRVARFEVPDEATPEQAQQMMSEHFVQPPEPEQPGRLADKIPPTTPQPRLADQVPNTVASAKPVAKESNPVDEWLLNKFGSTLAKAPNIQGSIPGRFIQGAADLPIGAMQLGMNLAGQGDVINPKLAEIGARTQALRGPDAGFDFARLAGSMANPLPYKAASAIPPAATLTGKVAQGAAFGAGLGATAPVETGNFAEQKVLQTGAGAATGAILPLAISAVKSIGGTLRDVSDLILPGGAQRIFEKYQNRILGANEQDREKIVAALRGADEYVRGSKPTAAEAVVGIPQASPLQGYQNIIAATPGGPSGAFGQRIADQEAARRAALQTISKSPQALQSAVQERSAKAAENYATAFGQQVRADPKLMELSKNPFFAKAVPDAMELAKAKGINPKENLTEFLHFVKIGMDRQLLPNGNNALTNTQQNAINNVRADLVDWLNKRNPAYDYARNEFAQQSQVIDRMKVGKALEDKLVSATGKETPGSFATAVRNEVGTLKRATGQPRYEELRQLMTPEETATINNVLADVTRRSQAFNQPQRTNLYGGFNVAEETTPRLPNLLSRPAMIVNAVAKGLGQNVEKEVERIATNAYLNPQKLADLLEKLPTKQQNKLLDLFKDTRTPMYLNPSIYATQGQQQ